MGPMILTFRRSFLLILLLALSTSKAFSEHIVGGDIYWECLPSGKFKFYLILYRDCAAATQVSPSGHNLEIWNDTNFVNAISLNLVSQADVSPVDCGINCSGAGPGDVATEQYVFESNPVSLNVVPSVNGLTVTYHRCCRGQANNLQDATNSEIYYQATMYPYDGQDLFPCYDSSPQFAELPTALLCSGYELRYNSGAVDSDADSLSYNFAPVLGSQGFPMTYEAGYSPNVPLPGPSLAELDSLTGQMNYDSELGVQGRWNVVTEVSAWRCGQRISSSMREMTVSIIPCSAPNSIPEISDPNWMAPSGNSGYEVTVHAGDLVNFSLTGTDNDSTTGNPQLLRITAVGSQFGTDFTDASSGCPNPPCATLTNVSPPATAYGSIGTTFNWQTDCNHVVSTDECVNYSTTYNFVFKFQDDFCPAQGIHMVNVAVTVLADSVVESPEVHCVSMLEDGAVELMWEPATDPFVPSAFDSYVVFYSTNPNGPFQQIGVLTDIDTTGFVHSSGNPVVAPSAITANYYQVRTRSGCQDNVLAAPIRTLSSIYLTVEVVDSTAVLEWTPVADPPLWSSNGNGLGLYKIYREHPAGNWVQVSVTSDLTFSEPAAIDLEGVNYRIELTDLLPCASVSNVAGYIYDGISNHEVIQVDVVPNPNDGRFVVSADGGTKFSHYEVWDMTGRLLLSRNLNVASDRLTVEEELASGTYLLRVFTEKGVGQRKVVVTE